jgi:hypothetical protein
VDDRRKSVVRFPVTLYIDKVEFEPQIDPVIVRTAYDFELTEYDMKILYEGLKHRLENKIIVPTRIRFTGRLVS